MPDLLARGKLAEHWWRQPLGPGQIVLGRDPARSKWVVPWDPLVSGIHAELTWQDAELHIRKFPTARNPILFQGQGRDEFRLAPGEFFIIGDTRFTLEANASPPTGDLPSPHIELTASAEELRGIKYSDADERIEVLALLPEAIRYSSNDTDLEARVIAALLQGIPRADAAAVVMLKDGGGCAEPDVAIRAWDRRAPGGGPIHPSKRLVIEAVQRTHQSVMHVWNSAGPSASSANAGVEFTQGDNSDWALCAPFPGDTLPNAALYVAGRVPRDWQGTSGTARQQALKSDLKFAELVAEVFGSLRQIRELQRMHGLLSGFFSLPVRTALARQDVEQLLQARIADVTVLFCDIRGSCRIAEEGRADLHATWDNLNEALTVMTRSISDQGGVIGDFHGDAAMGFWGWPIVLEGDRPVERACRAALNISRDFLRAARKEGHALFGIHCGIGIASGTAIAGRLGTDDQFKAGVFGPVVNLASRLESMTKVFQVPILVDDQTVELLPKATLKEWCRIRPLAQVRPVGMQLPVKISELLPPVGHPSAPSELLVRDYNVAYQDFCAGNWQQAARRLKLLTQDGSARFLLRFIEKHNLQPPSPWDQVIPLATK
jgi:adenylate cyclase